MYYFNEQGSADYDRPIEPNYIEQDVPHRHTEVMNRVPFQQVEDLDRFYTTEHERHRNLNSNHLNNSDSRQPSTQKKQSIGLFRVREKRPFQQIKISAQTKTQYHEAVKGNRAQTSQLNINTKTLTKNILARSKSLKHLTPEQLRILQQFQKSSANFQTTQQLFGVLQSQTNSQEIVVGAHCDNLRKTCYQEYSSSRFVRSILKAQKMAFKNKITMIRFLQTIRFGAAFPQELKKWKKK